MSDLVITRIFESDPHYEFSIKRLTGVGFIANHEIFRRLMEESGFLEGIHMVST